MSNYVKVANVDESTNLNTRKFVQVKILKSIKLQLDSGFDFSIINVYTWEKNWKPNVNGCQENRS